MVEAFHEILEFLRISVLPALVRGGRTPSLLGADLLHRVDIFKDIFPRIEALHCIHRIHVATSAVVVTEDLHPVVNSAHDHFGRKNIRNSSVGKLDVDLRVILDIVVAGAQEAFIPIIWEPGEFMRAAAYCRWPNRGAVPRFTFYAL